MKKWKKGYTVAVFAFLMLISFSFALLPHQAFAGYSMSVKVSYCVNNDYSCTAQGEPYCCRWSYYYTNKWVEGGNYQIHYW